MAERFVIMVTRYSTYLMAVCSCKNWVTTDKRRWEKNIHRHVELHRNRDKKDVVISERTLKRRIKKK